MSSFLDRIFGHDRKSANEAKERLKLVLIHDRTDLAPGVLESLKDELIEVISRYVAIDPDRRAHRDGAGWAPAAPAGGYPLADCAAEEEIRLINRDYESGCARRQSPNSRYNEYAYHLAIFRLPAVGGSCHLDHLRHRLDPLGGGGKMSSWRGRRSGSSSLP